MKRLKKSIIIIFCFIIPAGFTSFLVLKPTPDPKPLFIFRGYEKSSTNTTQIAKFELRNTTGRDIWLCFSGKMWPLEPPFLEYPMAESAPRSDSNAHTLDIGSFFMQGQKLPRGETVTFDFTVVCGKPPVQVGVCYYTGNFANGNDFLDKVGMPLLNLNAGLGEIINFFRAKLKRLRKAPDYHEIWSQQQVSFQGREPKLTNSAISSTNEQ